MEANTRRDTALGRKGQKPEAVLGKRSLNRALLERQLLLRRADMSVPDALERLAGMQAQVPNPPYIGLWTRLNGFRHEDLSELMRSRQAVRIALMRSTIHLVTARDCLAFRPVLQPFLERALTGSYGKRLAGLDIGKLATAGRAIVEEQPMTFGELGKLLLEQFPGREPAALANTVRNIVPLVQIPPRGIWGSSGQAAHTSVEAWLGRSLDSVTEPDGMILRYLAAFGPATVKDMQVWSGLTRLNEAVDRLRPQLVAYEDADGNELLDVIDGPLPNPDIPAPVRFLSEFDNMLLSYADRTRIIADEHRSLVFTENGIIRATILVDGFVGGIWRIERHRKAATLTIEPFGALSADNSAALLEEGSRLLDFAAADAASRDIRFALPE
jgi:hypothetical protein